MSFQKYTEWQPKNICKKTACPPPCNSNENLCDSLDNYCPSKFYRVTISNSSSGSGRNVGLLDLYSNIFYFLDGNEIVLYFPLESKNLILINENDQPCYSNLPPIELLQYCSKNNLGGSFLLTIDSNGKSDFKIDSNNSDPIPSPIYKVILDADNFDIAEFDESEQTFPWQGIIHNFCCTYGFVWLPTNSIYTNYSSQDDICTVPPTTLQSKSCQFFADKNDTCKPVGNSDTNKKLNNLKDKFKNFNFNKFKNVNKDDKIDKDDK
jgi:hypothetical protein